MGWLLADKSPMLAFIAKRYIFFCGYTENKLAILGEMMKDDGEGKREEGGGRSEEGGARREQ